MQYNSSVVLIVFPITPNSSVADFHTFAITPHKRRVEAAFICCVDVSWTWGMERLFEFPVRIVTNELESRRGLYLFGKYHNDPYVRGTRFRRRVVERVLDT